MNTISLIQSQIQEIKDLHLVESVEIIVSRDKVFKARLVVSENIFIQIYRNEKFSTTSFALILNRERIYGQDEIEGEWHLHPFNAPDTHIKSSKIDLLEFWQEVEKILKKLKLIR